MDHDKLDELDALIDAVIEGGATDAEYAKLDTLLDGDAAAQSHYVRRLDVHNTLRWMVESDATRRAIGELRDAGVEPGVAGTARPALRLTDGGDDAAAWRRLRRLATGLAAMIAVGVVIAVAMQRQAVRSVDTPAHATATTDRSPIDVVTHPNTAPPRVVADAIATLRDATGVITSRSQDTTTALYTGDQIAAESIALAADASARIVYTDGVTLRVQGPAQLTLHDARRARIISGRAMLRTSGTPGGFTLITPGATFTDAGTELGVDVTVDGALRAAVFRGEVAAEVVDRYVGIPQRVTLTRDDGLDVSADGYVTTAIIADAGRFAELRDAAASRAPTIANSSFEYPRTDHFTKLAASGWTLMSHPVANAEGMRVSAGVVGAERVAVDSTGRTPAAPHGVQWAYLNAETFADGKLAHTSMHQAVGEVAEGVTYRLNVTVGQLADTAPTRESAYTVGLYAGSRESGPSLPLHVWRDPVTPVPGASATATLDYRSPMHTPFRGQMLFIVIEAVPGSQPGVRQVLIDSVRLQLIDDNDSDSDSVARADARARDDAKTR